MILKRLVSGPRTGDVGGGRPPAGVGLRSGPVFEEIGRSDIVKNNLNPTWPQLTLSPLERAGPLSSPVLFEVYDWDRGSSDDYMGEVYVEAGLQSLLGKEREITLQLVKGPHLKNSGKNRGKLFVKLGIVQPDPLVMMRGP